MLSLILLVFGFGLLLAAAVIGWIVVNGFLTVWRMANGQIRRPDGVSARCGNAGCRTVNPQHARFCRRCGTSLTAGTVQPFVTTPMPLRQDRPMPFATAVVR